MPAVVNSVSDSFYKIMSEALLVAQQLVKVIRPIEPLQPLNHKFASYISDLYECTLRRLKAADIDQEVKERAISCMAQLLYNVGDSLNAQLPVSLAEVIQVSFNHSTSNSVLVCLSAGLSTYPCRQAQK